MASFEDLYAPWKQQARVGIKSGVGVINTGIDVANLFLELDDHFKPLDMDRDIFEAGTKKAAQAIGDATDPTRGARVGALLTSLTKAPEAAHEQIAEDAGVFLLGFLSGRSFLTGGVAVASKGAALGRAGKIGVDLAAGAASAFTLENPEANRLVNYIPEKHRPAFIEYLAYDPDGDESRLEGRFKNALVDMGLGVLGEGAFGLIGKTFKHLRRGIHLEAAGDPTVAAKLAADKLGMAVPPPLPRGLPEVSLTSEAFEASVRSGATPPALPLKSFLTPESEAKAVKALFELDIQKGVEPVDAAFRAMNHSHFDYRNPEASIKTANALLETMAPLMDNQGIQTWDDVLKASNKLASKETLDSFEAIAKLTGKATEDVAKATPVTHLIRRMYVESGNELEIFKSKFFTSTVKEQANMIEEFGGRVQTHMALTGGISELGTAAGRLLRSFGMRAKGDLGIFDSAATKELIKEKGAKEGLARAVSQQGDAIEDRLAKALAENDAFSVGRAVEEATKDELFRLVEALKSVDMREAKAWIKGDSKRSGLTMKVLDTLRKIKMMNILSGVPTFTVNNTGNTASLLFRQGFEDIIASLIPSRAPDRMRLMGQLRGMRASAQQPIELLGSLWTQTAKASKSGEPLGETLAKLAVDDVSRLQEERIAIDLLVQSNAPWAKVVNGYGKFAHAISFGHLGATDAVYKQSMFASEVTALAHSKGVLKGLKGRALVEFEEQAVSQAIFLARKGKEGARFMVASLQQKGMPIEEVVKHLDEIGGMVSEGRKNAKSGVFQDDIGIGVLKDFEGFLNKRSAGNHLLKTVVFPFYRTPVKIVEFFTDRTPLLNLASQNIRADLRGLNGTRARQRAIAKMITGTMMYSGAMMLAQNKMITGKHRPDERAAMLAAKIPEYSIRVPHTDHWIAYQRLDPFAIFLGVTADMNKLVEDDKLDAGTAVAGLMNALTSNVLHKTFMKGLSDSLKASENPSAFGAYYADSQIRSIVSPLNAFQRSFEKVWNANSEEYRKQKPDPALSELRGWVDILIGDTGLTDTREYDMSDALGNKVERQSLWADLTGMKLTETDDSPAMRQLALHKRFPSNRELSLATGFKMTQDEFLKFKEILGKDVKVKERLDRIVSSGKYRRASSDEQVKLLDKVIRDSRKLAKAILIRRDPSVRSAVTEFKKQRLLDSLNSAEKSTGIPSIDQILTNRRVKIERL